jgi:hypothetical protein
MQATTAPKVAVRSEFLQQEFDSESTEATVLQRLQKVESLVESLMVSWLDNSALIQSRQSHRVRQHAVFAITPFSDNGEEPTGETRLANVWDISRGGISFTHDGPLSYRVMATTFARADGVFETTLTRLKWCRFTRLQKYRSGGSFLRLLDSGFSPEIDLELLSEC